jgi:hypothetical protein
MQSFSKWQQQFIINEEARDVPHSADLCPTQDWNDYNLKWNESEFGGVKDLRITPNKIWRPDILMYNR